MGGSGAALLWGGDAAPAALARAGGRLHGIGLADAHRWHPADTGAGSCDRRLVAVWRAAHPLALGGDDVPGHRHSYGALALAQCAGTGRCLSIWICGGRCSSPTSTNNTPMDTKSP